MKNQTKVTKDLLQTINQYSERVEEYRKQMLSWGVFDRKLVELRLLCQAYDSAIRYILGEINDYTEEKENWEFQRDINETYLFIAD